MTNEKSNVPDPSQDNWKRDCYDWLQMLTFVLVAVVMVFTFFRHGQQRGGQLHVPHPSRQGHYACLPAGYTPAQ